MRLQTALHRRGIRLALAGATSLAAAAALAAPGAAAPVADWVSAPAEAPAPPAGVAPARLPVPVGRVGQISFWAPDRGLLITGGDPNGEPVPAGLYAYNGVSWHQLTTVCGGAEGRIAWASENEFWTISNQRPGQITGREANTGELAAVSLCHFSDGQVVGSYAMPLGGTESYSHMDAAACFSADDCWFSGEDSAAGGAFHLYWNGTSLSEVLEPEDHAVNSMALYAGKMYEGLTISPTDTYIAGEEAARPALVHTIAEALTADPFADVTMVNSSLKQLPEYPTGVLPDAFEGVQLATDGGPLGAGATQLWAIAAPARTPPAGSKAAPFMVLRFAPASSGGNPKWSQVLPKVTNLGVVEPEPLPEGTRLAGALNAGASGPTGSSEAVAAEPGSDDVWLSLVSAGDKAQLAELSAEGTLVGEPVSLPGVDEQETIEPQGEAGPVTCPAAGDCWMATETGWLYHYSDGVGYPKDEDPYFAGVITSRPPDQGVPEVYPTGFAEDDSLANQAPLVQPSEPPSTATPSEAAQSTAPAKKAKAIATHIKSRLLHHRRLVLTFTLTAKAHVQLLGRRGKKVVAKTKLETMKAGRRSLSLVLHRKDWPKKLQFKANPVGKSSSSGAGGEEAVGGEDTITT